MQYVDRQLIPQRQPEHACDQTQRQRVQQQHPDHRSWRVSVASQLGHQPLTLRHRQEHRVEREQESDERADDREQDSRLVARRRGLREQRLVVVDRLHIEPACREPLECRPDPSFRTRRGRDQDSADATLQARQFLRIEQRRQRHWSRGQRPDPPRRQLFIQRSASRAPGKRQRDFLTEPVDADRACERAGQHDRADTPERFQRHVPDERPAESRQARVRADQLHRLAAPRAARLCSCFEQRRRDTHTGDPTHPCEHALREAMRVACQELEGGVTRDSARELGDRAAKALTGDLRGEQQRHTRGDAEDREALAHQPRAQAHAVEPQHVPRLHSAQARSGSRSASRPSRSASTRSA